MVVIQTTLLIWGCRHLKLVLPPNIFQNTLKLLWYSMDSSHRIHHCEPLLQCVTSRKGSRTVDVRRLNNALRGASRSVVHSRISVQPIQTEGHSVVAAVD